MAVNFPVIQASELNPVDGVTLGWAQAGIKSANRKDVLVVTLEPGTAVAGVFTTNRFCAAPVTVCREHLTQSDEIRALVVNTGNANAGTGVKGLQDARDTCATLAELLKIKPNQVLPFSTGVILEPLPIDRLITALPQALANQSAGHWFEAAESIMTTDTLPKAVSEKISISGHAITLTGISKGSGMIKPNMATMLGFLATDAAISTTLLHELVKEAADQSFNCITVDGDTSTNDSFVLLATGKSTLPKIVDRHSVDCQTLRQAVIALSKKLAQLIIRDGEGATKFIEIQVEQAKSLQECRQVAYAIAHSPLVKTAFYASDPNLGRILAAIGYAGLTDLDIHTVSLYLNEVCVAQHGERHSDYQEEDGQRVMKGDEIIVRVVLGRGQADLKIWTTDLSIDYVKINADYRS